MAVSLSASADFRRIFVENALLRPSLCSLARWALSLKGRLLIGLAAAWVVVAVLLLWAGWVSSRTLAEATSFTHLRYEARLIAEELTHNVEARLGALERLADQLSPGEDSHPEVHDLLRANGSLLEWFDGLVVIDADGRIWADWPEVAGREGLDVSGRDFFKHLAHFKRPHVSEPFHGRASDEALVLFGAPVLDERGRFLGAVGGLVSVREGGLFGRLSRIRLGEGGFAGIATAAGTVLYHPDEEKILQPLPPEHLNPWARLAQYGWEGEALGPLAWGDTAFQAYRQIWPADWLVGVFVPQEQVMAPVEALMGRLSVLGLLVASLLLPLMGWVVWRVLQPLYRLERQINAVGEGRRTRVDLVTHMHELQRVVDTFNRVEHQRGEAHARLRDRQAFLEAVLASSPLGMFVTDTTGRVTFMNEALVALTGHSVAGDDLGRWVRQIHPEDRQSAAELWQHSLASGRDFLRQFRYVNDAGETLWLEVHASQVVIDGKAIGFVGTVKDITERRQEEAMRRWEAEHDPLTGLLNRRGFERRLEEALAEWCKVGTPSALLLFDLDRFKPINDEGGHALGDEMLRRIARVVARTVRASDHVARQGGDEFAVLLPSCTLEQAERIAESLRIAVGDVTLAQAGRVYRVSLSIGITTIRSGDREIAKVIERADAASYRAKAAGRNRVAVDGG